MPHQIKNNLQWFFNVSLMHLVQRGEEVHWIHKIITCHGKVKRCALGCQWLLAVSLADRILMGVGEQMMDWLWLLEIYPNRVRFPRGLGSSGVRGLIKVITLVEYRCGKHINTLSLNHMCFTVLCFSVLNMYFSNKKTKKGFALSYLPRVF